MSLLIAGALGLDASGLIAGRGALAAIAAAPVMQVQLWARAGDYPAQALGILSRHAIDCSGVGTEGAVVPIAADQASPRTGALLPEVEPTSAEGLKAMLIIALSDTEEARALEPAITLQSPLLILAGRSNPLAPLTRQPEVLVVSVARATQATGCSDPLAAGRALQHSGARAVVLTAGMLGGLVFFGDKAVSYPAQPLAGETSYHGAGAVFAGALAGWCAGAGADFNALKRGCALASAVAGIYAQGGVRKLLGCDRAQYMERFNRLRRAAKY